MDSLDTIMALKNHYGFEYVHDSQFPRQSKNKVFVFKMLKDFGRNNVHEFWWNLCQYGEAHAI